MNTNMSKLRERLFASECTFLQICGIIFKPWFSFLFLAALVSLLRIRGTIGLLVGSVLILVAIIYACTVLTNIFNLLRKEKDITNCQIAILCSIGAWIIVVIFILDIQKGTTSTIAFALIGSVLTWVFQDKIKGAATFIDFRLHKLLNIDDWIQIPKLGVDGEIKKVTLTTITLYNRDTTTSTIPINALQSEHFINLQKMREGKTYGRRMMQTFTIDTGWVHPIDSEEAAFLKSDKHNILEYIQQEDIKEGELNINLYRLYLYHWLMNNPNVSLRPLLMVRWVEHSDSGLVLQVYAFLLERELDAFEWQQSIIIEHVIASMAWFGLRLYQCPSAYDASNSNIYMADAPADYKIENK